MNPFLKIAYQPYKWIIVIPFVFIITLVLGLVCIFSGLLFKQSGVNLIAVTWSKLCCAIAPLKVIITGKKNYSRDTSYVVVSNHQSMADIPVIHGHLGLKIKWIMKKELGKIPIFGPACHHLGCIYVDRKNHKAAMKSIRKAQEELSENASVLFFSEGTRSRDGKVKPFKKGAFKFAREMTLPILPITIKTSLHVLPPDSLDLIPGIIEIIVHRPIHISEHHMDHLDDVVEQTRQIISSAL